jgi:hypothetical protein
MSGGNSIGRYSLVVTAAVLFMPGLGGLRDSRTPIERAGSEVYIEQPPKKALKKKDTDSGSDGDKGTLKPAQGPAAPTGQPTMCDPQNASSEACYTATQQARPILR